MPTTTPDWSEVSGWRRDAVHYPARPLHPLDISFVVETVGPGSEVGFVEWSLPMERIADKAVNGGWVYTRLEPAGDPPEALVRLMSKFPFFFRLWRVIPPLRKRVLGFDAFLAQGGFEGQIDTWDERWRPEAERRVADLRRLDIATANRSEMAAQLEAWHEYMTWQWSVHIRIHLVCFFVRGKLVDICRRLLGLSDLDAYELIKRSDPVLLEPPRKLAAIARRAADDQTVAAALRESPNEALADLSGTWFEDALTSFLDAHGDVPIDGFEAALPTWRELPHRVVGLVQQMRRHDPDAEDASFQARRQQRIEELRGRLSGGDLAEFDRWLALGERAYPLNDTHNYVLFELPVGLVRYAALRAGELLAADGLLDQTSDVFFLYLGELTTLLREGGDVRSLVARRREDLAYARTLDPPEFVGAQPVPPTDPFPPRVAEAVRILVAQSDKMYGNAMPVQSAAGAISGVAGSPGSAEGNACVVTGVHELDKVREGDVLVCHITGPAWTVVFPIISGLVTDAGGALSHPAIVAREFGIPSVVGTGNATRVLRDGQRVRLDGTKAVVEVLEHAPLPADHS